LCRRRRLQDSKHASWQRNAVGGGESNCTTVPSHPCGHHVKLDYPNRPAEWF
jgi:hypothetical protein